MKTVETSKPYDETEHIRDGTERETI